MIINRFKDFYKGLSKDIKLQIIKIDQIFSFNLDIINEIKLVK